MAAINRHLSQSLTLLTSPGRVQVLTNDSIHSSASPELLMKHSIITGRWFNWRPWDDEMADTTRVRPAGFPDGLLTKPTGCRLSVVHHTLTDIPW